MDFSFCPTLAEMLQTKTARGESGRVFTGLGALSTVNNLLVLRRFMQTHKPAATLEVGLAFGGSCLAIAASHREYSKGAKQHVAIDPYQPTNGEWGWDNAGFRAIREAGLTEYVDVREELSSLALPQLLRDGRMFDLIYIDGSHFFDDVFIDAYYAVRLLKPNGVVMLDDSATNHVAKVVSFIRSNWSGWVPEVDLSAYRSTDWKYRIAHRLGRVQLTAFRRMGEDSRPWDAPLHRF